MMKRAAWIALAQLALALAISGTSSAQDADGDGVLDAADYCTGPDGTDTDGDGVPSGCDCDESDATIRPGAPDGCDRVDNDCDGRLDVHAALDASGTQLISMIARGEARNPSLRAIVGGGASGRANVATGAAANVYLRAPVELFGGRGRSVRVVIDRTRFTGDRGTVVGLSDGTNVVLAGLYGAGLRWQPGAFRARDRESTLDELTPLETAGLLPEDGLGPNTFIFEFGDAPVIHAVSGSGERSTIELPQDPAYDLDPSLPWEVILYAPSADPYEIKELAVLQDLPHPAGGVDADGDGWAAACECDDGDALVNPAVVDVCNGLDEDCGGDGDANVLFGGTGRDMLSDIVRGVASAPPGAITRLEGEERLLSFSSVGNQMIYRRRLEVRRDSSRLFSPRNVVEIDVALEVDPSGFNAFQVGVTDGTNVVALEIYDPLLAGSWIVDPETGVLGPSMEFEPDGVAVPRAFPDRVRDLSIRFRLTDSGNRATVNGEEVRFSSSTRMLDLGPGRSLDLVIFRPNTERTIRTRIDAMHVSQPVRDYDDDGLCDAIDACYGPDGVDADADGVGANCDCDDADPRAHLFADEICDGAAQTCGAPDERVYLDVGPEGLLHLLHAGRAENSGRLYFTESGGGLRFVGPSDTVGFRFTLADFDVGAPLTIVAEGRIVRSNFVLGMFPIIWLSDGDRARGIYIRAMERVGWVRRRYSFFSGDDRGSRITPTALGLETRSGFNRSARVTLVLQVVAGELVVVVRVGEEETTFTMPYDLAPGQPVQLVLTEAGSDAVFESIRVSQFLPDADGDAVCDGIDQCPGHDDRVDGDRDGLPDFCDVCLGADGPDVDADGYPSGCDCDDGDPSIHPGARDVCDRVDQDCDGVLDRHVALAARGIELLGQIGSGRATNPSGRVLTAPGGGGVVRVEPDPEADAWMPFYRAPLDLLSGGASQRFDVLIEREPLVGDHDLTVLITDGTTAFGVGLFDHEAGSQVQLTPVVADDVGSRLTSVTLSAPSAIDEASPYQLQFVLGEGDPRIEVTAADGGVATLTVPAAALGALDVSSLSLLLVAQGPDETYVIRRVEVTQHLPDADGDLVCDAADRCSGVDDLGPDGDRDGFADACDICPGGDDVVDTDGDGVPNACDTCSDEDDMVDGDGDGLPDACDPCPSDSANDSDGDMVCDRMDLCLPGDDSTDTDGDGIPDDCDLCPVDGMDDSDEDGTCDAADICQGDDRTGDEDADGHCADRDCDDTRASVYPGAEEICDGFDSNCSGEIPESELDVNGDLMIDCLAETSGGGCSASGGSASASGGSASASGGYGGGLALALLALSLRRRTA